MALNCVDFHREVEKPWSRAGVPNWGVTAPQYAFGEPKGRRYQGGGEEALGEYLHNNY